MVRMDKTARTEATGRPDSRGLREQLDPRDREALLVFREKLVQLEGSDLEELQEPRENPEQ